jgi:hypothetical protein
MNKQFNIDIIANDKTKQALKGVQQSLGGVKNSVFSLKSAFIGLGAGLVIRSFVNVGKEVESLQVRFKFLFGSINQGKIAFDNLTKYAAKVPFSLQEISRASGNLAVVAKDADDLNRVLEITGNVAAVTGLDFETTASQIQRSFAGGIGAADLFRERGVRALLGFSAGAKVTAEETVKRFEELFSGDGKFAGATTDLSTTLEGILSMLGDKYFKFQKDVAIGFFDELKKEFGDLNKFLEDNELQIETIAKDLGGIAADSILIVGEAFVVVKDNAELFYDILKSIIALRVAVWAITTAKAMGLLSSGILAAAGASEVFLNVWTFGLKGAGAKVIKWITDIAKLNDDEFAPSFRSVIDEIQGLLDSIDQFNNNVDKITSGYISAEESAENFQKSMRDVYEATRIVTEETEKQTKSSKELAKAQKELIQLMKDLRKARLDAEDAKMASIYEFDPARAEIDAEKNKQAELKRLRNEGFISEEKYRKQSELLTKESSQKLFELYKKGLVDELDWSRLSQEQKNQIAIKGGREALGELAKYNKQAFRLNQALALGDAIMSTAQGVAAGLKKGFPVGYIEAAITAAKGAAQIAAIKSAPPPRALGGSVTAGQPYIVGEQGREMFVPNQSGTIVSNDNLNKGTIVNVSILANDTQGFDDLLVKRRSTIINVINDALNSRGKEALI